MMGLLEDRDPDDTTLTLLMSDDGQEELAESVIKHLTKETLLLDGYNAIAALKRITSPRWRKMKQDSTGDHKNA